MSMMANGLIKIRRNIMKKLLGLVLSFVLLISVFNFGNLNVFAATYGGTCGPNVKWSFNSTNGLLNITGSGDMYDYDYEDAPTPWEDYYLTGIIKKVVISSGVTSIGVNAFYYCSSLTSVTLPNSIARIGDSAFSYCRSLTSVTIPNSVTSIGDCAFEICGSLTSVTIPDSVKSIGDYAFNGCYSLINIIVDNGNIKYSSENGVLFNKGKTKLIQYPAGNTRTSYNIPNTVKSIGKGAFDSCGSLTSVTIGNSVTSIGRGAFERCGSLTSVTIPNSVTSIGDGAFELCESLTSVTIGNSVTRIGNSAFSECESLTSVTIPNSVTSIGGGAFYYCPSLKSVKIGNSVTSIGAWAFASCESLTSVTIPNSVTSIGDYAFEACSSLSTVHIGYGVREIGTKAFSYCPNLKSIIIPNSVTSIGKFAFGAYTDIEEKWITNKQFIIYGHSGNKSEYYAKNSGVRFIDCHKGSTSITKSTLSKNGKKVVNCAICNKTVTSTIYYPKKMTLSTTSYTYNGKVKKPSVKVVGSNGKTISSSNYTVSYASGRKKVGKYKVTVRFRGNYSGTKTLYFTIKPKATSIKSLSAGSKRFTVKWYKRTTQTTGYQVQYSTSSKFSSPKTVTIGKTGTTYKTVKKLRARKRYYVRVRTYKTVNGTRYYSSWSKAKYVTTKR